MAAPKATEVIGSVSRSTRIPSSALIRSLTTGIRLGPPISTTRSMSSFLYPLSVISERHNSIRSIDFLVYQIFQLLTRDLHVQKYFRAAPVASANLTLICKDSIHLLR